MFDMKANPSTSTGHYSWQALQLLGIMNLDLQAGKIFYLQKPFKLEIDNLQTWLLSVTREILQTQSKQKIYQANKPTNLIYVSYLVEDKNELF